MPEEEGTTVSCPDCNQDFVVSPGEIKFLKERFGADFAMPKRCKPCREANKQRKQNKRNGGGRRDRR
jgi:ssDNA-binding Zn-finger/Zn-ribbon topoisomerase 1